ncbi:histone-lysine N-methyltransferase SETDB2 isoform X2 [Ochotona princeps]|uniref:histone-lysine N-methyltransferase SETDB2 isoform X2 n=1 Tax=Ochotona princeps TaxID=9978 RepID=UPI002714C0E0|nr:histone-lysine N-methyltransferase SETDB2 isoform X2 [Ochotona princeps]
MGEKNGDAKAFWMELKDCGKVDFTFEQVQNVLQSLKQKIKDGSATNKEYIQAMVLVNEATLSNNLALIKGHTPVIHDEKRNEQQTFPSSSYENSFPEDCTLLSTENKEILPLENNIVNLNTRTPSLNLPYQSHHCSGACLMKLSTFKGENPLQLPIKCHFQRFHAKTNSRSAVLHVSYKAPCGRSLRNMEEVYRYLLETECNFLFPDNFSFNTYVQLTRNYPKQEEIVSDVDISNGVESVPISFCNEIDSRKLPQFKYRKTMWPRTYYLNSFSNMFTDACDCSEGCIDITKCACLQLTARNAEICHLSTNQIVTGYKYKRLQRQVPTGIYECSLLCKCNRQMCQNRVVQHGPQLRLQVYKTEKKGWGVRCLDDIDRGTFVCIYSGRLLIRANPEKPNADNENEKEETVMKSILSKKRKIEVSCSDGEVEVIPAELEAHHRRENCSPKLSKSLNESVPEMKCNSISRIKCHSVIKTSKSKIAIFEHDEKKMGFISLESDTSEGDGDFKPKEEHLHSRARRMPKESSSSHIEDSEDKRLIELDVIDITKCREETPPQDKCIHPTTLNNRNIKKAQIQKHQMKNCTACQNQQVFCDDELSSETTNTSSDSPAKSKSEHMFLLDATKEGNVGRFLNHSCCPNLWVQNVFVETHDRNFPLVAFFTNRYVKARTELTWDYGYEAGTVPEKEIMCQCTFQVAEKMEKRTCALCPSGADYSVMYFAQAENIAAHENCLLFSSGLVECEDHDPYNRDRNFDVESVKKEIQRGRKLKCTHCHKRGATAGCDLKSCSKNYHFFCAKTDNAFVQNDRVKGIYKVLCQQHAPKAQAVTQSDAFPRKRGRKKHLSVDNHELTREIPTSSRQIMEESRRDTDAVVKADFLKKCKEAGLLNELFEELLDKLYLVQAKLMDNNTSESEYEDIGTSLFDCGFFEDTILNFAAAIEKKINKSEERQQQLKKEIELLKGLKQTLCCSPDNTDLMSSSASMSSLSS